MIYIPFTIRNFQSREKVRLGFDLLVQLLEVGCKGIVWTVSPRQNQNQEPAKNSCSVVYD